MERKDVVVSTVLASTSATVMFYYKSEVSCFTDPQGRCATSPDTSFLRILLCGVWSTLQLKCVFTCPHYCWQWEKQKQSRTGPELVQWCPRATHYSRSVWSSLWFPLTENVFSFSELLFHISNTIALLQKEKIKHTPHRSELQIYKTEALFCS